MTSDRKIKANRANARASTGPKTAQGRVRTAETRFATGSAFPFAPIQHSRRRWKRLRARSRARAPTRKPRIARRVAEAQIDLRRVRYARYQLLSRALADPYYEPRENTRNKVAILRFLLQKNAPDLPIESLVAFLKSTPQGPYKIATILSQEAKQLLAMDRYERRALSRRKSAIRALDDMPTAN